MSVLNSKLYFDSIHLDLKTLTHTHYLTMFDGLGGIPFSIYILALGMAYAIGANDAANALATSFGSGAVKLLPLVLCGSVFEFIGAAWGS